MKWCAEYAWPQMYCVRRILGPQHNKLFQSMSNKWSTHLQTAGQLPSLLCPQCFPFKLQGHVIIWKFVHPKHQKSPEWHLIALIGRVFVPHCAGTDLALLNHFVSMRGSIEGRNFFAKEVLTLPFLSLFCCRSLQCSKTMRRFSRIPPLHLVMMIQKSRKSRK